MKKSLFILSLITLITVGCAKKDEPATITNEPTAAQKTQAALIKATDKTKEAVGDAAAKTKEVAIDAKNAISDKLVAWKLTPDDIKADLQKSGRVVREKGSEFGSKAASTFDNAVIITSIKAKYVADKDLSALKVGVAVDQGVVTLDGSVASVELIGKAVGLALDTDGVTQVVSLITIDPTK